MLGLLTPEVFSYYEKELFRRLSFIAGLGGGCSSMGNLLVSQHLAVKCTENLKLWLSPTRHLE
jgi:hypothetical protein